MIPSLGSKKLLLCLLLTFVVVLESAENRTVKIIKKHQLSVLSDLPRKTDLNNYMKALDKILTFCTKNKNDIDINFFFGLFLADVNLKSMISSKAHSLPPPLRVKLKEMVTKTEKLLNFFDYMVHRDRDPRNQKNKLIYTLFSNESMWTDRIKKFSVCQWKHYPLTDKQLEEKYSKWNIYMKNVDNVQSWTPKPHESDMCMVSLASNSLRRHNFLPKCKISESCYEILIKGSDFGYALSHRLLLLLLARYGRGCVVFTPLLDKELSRRFCAAAYDEAEYIANNGFQIPDLLLEQMTLCSIDDHPQFLRRSWLTELLHLQTVFGCFTQDLDSSVHYELVKKTKKWTMSKAIDEQAMMGGNCDRHFTAVAAAAMALASRYIIETEY